MNKKLTAKTQKLSPKIPDSAQSFSNAFSVDPDSDEMLERKGSLFVAFDVSSTVTFDTLLVTKVVHDLLHNSYFQSESVSPIQSLEKAVVDVRDRVTGMAKEADKAGDTSVSFNIVAAVLWGNVLYIVQYGKGGSFLVRDGEVKNVNSASEGHFSVASGVVKNDDVVILGTEKFLEAYPPQDLLKKASEISSYDLNLLASAILLKFEVDSSFTQDEFIDFGLEDEKNMKNDNDSQDQGGMSIASKPRKEKMDIKNKLGLKLKPKGSRFKVPFTLVIILIALLFIASVFLTLRSGGSSDQEEGFLAGIIASVRSLLPGSEDPGPPTGVSVLPPGQTAEESTDSESSESNESDAERAAADAAAGITRVGNEAFYDIKVADEAAQPGDIAVIDGLVVVSDLSSGNIYTSDLETPQFEAVSAVFPGIGNLVYYGGDLAFSDSEGYKVYSPSTDEVVESYVQDGLGVTGTYLDFVYELAGDSITKYEKSGDTLAGELWGQSAEFEGGVSIAIDGSIYVLRSDGELVSFTSGEQDDFEISGLDERFLNPVEVVTSVDMDNLYIADGGHNRVVVLNKDGEFVRQFKPDDESVWGDIKGIGVSQDESRLFVLSGSKVFEVSLESSEPETAEDAESE